MRINAVVMMSVGMLSVATSAGAAGKAQGGCVIRNTDRDGPAPIYRGEDGDRIVAQAKRGDCFGGIITTGWSNQYQFEHKNNRVHIVYLTKRGMKMPHEIADPGARFTAWMNAADLEAFLYECGCGYGREEECAPTVSGGGFVGSTWNVCFQEARDRKLSELRAGWAQEAAGVAKSEPREEAKADAKATAKSEKPLTNDDVVGMVKAGLGDELTISKIKQAPTANLDVSTDELIRMKKEGASKAVIDAMMKRAAQAKAK